MTKICIIADNEDAAKRWASSQNLEKDQYFYAHHINDLLFHNNFHTIVIGVPSIYFEKLYNFALQRGRIGRI